jgi:Lipocalin-like domain
MQAWARVLLILSASLLASCGGSSGSGGSSGDTVTASPSTVSTLAGTWKATRAEFVSTTNSSQRVEIVSQGTVLTLTLDSSGTYTQKIVDPGQAGQTTTGTWTASKDVLQLQPAGMTWTIQFDMTLNGNTLALNGGHVEFDVNLDGKDEEALAYLTLTRQ